MKKELVILSLTTLLTVTRGRTIQDDACRPRPTYIPVHHPLWFYPRYIKVSRCFDTDHDHRYSKEHRCVAVDKRPVSVTVNNLQCDVYTHTTCGMRCACTVNGGTCRHLFGVDCYPGFQWDSKRCQCVEQCGVKKNNLRQHLKCTFVKRWRIVMYWWHIDALETKQAINNPSYQNNCTKHVFCHNFWTTHRTKKI